MRPAGRVARATAPPLAARAGTIPRGIAATEAQLAERPWGLLPALLVIAVLGLLVTVTGFNAGRLGQDGLARFLFWIGVIAIFAPAAAHAAMAGTTRFERLGGVVVVGVCLYLVKVLNSPVAFAFGDEHTHWRTAADILASGHLFTPNPLSLTSPVFPGLQIVTAAIVDLTGLPIQVAGLIVVGAGRVILMISMFLLVERLSASSRVAAVASFLYMGNPNFMFFTAQYAYESLALPLAVLAIYLAAIRTRDANKSRAIDIALLLTVLAVVITHHLTAYALAALLAIWSGLTVLMKRRGEVALPGPFLMAGVTAVAALAWLVIGAPVTFQYLVPLVIAAIRQAIDVITGLAPVRPLFAGDPALVSPTWERLIAFVDVAVISALLAWSLIWIARRVRPWDRQRANALVVTFALTSLLQFPALALRLVPRSSEISNRSSEFLFLPVGFILALAITELWLRRTHREIRRFVFTATATLVFMGGVIIGLSPWARIPGPYLVTGDTRAIQPESVAATNWLRSEFGTNHGLIADQTNAILMGSYGGEETIHGLSWIYFTAEIGAEVRRDLTTNRVRFIVVDWRMTKMLPVVGYYYENREPFARRHTEPIQPSQLEKFEGRSDMIRLFDSGNIVIYEFNPAAPG